MISSTSEERLFNDLSDLEVDTKRLLKKAERIGIPNLAITLKGALMLINLAKGVALDSVKGTEKS